MYCHRQHTAILNIPPQIGVNRSWPYTVQYYSCDDTKINYGWMDWKLTIWKHKLCMSATQKSNRRVINLSLPCYYNTQHILPQFLLTFTTLFQSCSSKIQGLCYQMLICSFFWNFCVQIAIHLQEYTQMLFFTPQYLERQSNQPQKWDFKSDTTEAHTI